MKLKKLKVGFFIDTFFPMVDGVTMVVHNYATIMSQFCDVTVFAPKGRVPFDDKTLPYNVVRCKKMKLIGTDYNIPLPRMDNEFLKKLSNTELDIVHIHSPFGVGKIGIEYAKKHNIPSIATMHSFYKKDFERYTRSKLISNMMFKKVINTVNLCDECWTVNEDVAKIYMYYGIKPRPKVINNATDCTYYDNPKELELLNKNIKLHLMKKFYCTLAELKN